MGIFGLDACKESIEKDIELRKKYDKGYENKTDEKMLFEILREYLAESATATWETSEGAAAFDNAGSLCHGWTAIPLYYQKYFVQKGF